MILFERMKRAIALRKDDVFLRAEFADMASVAQVSRALRRLIEDGIIVKLGVGVYAKAKKSVLSGNPIPVRPLEVLAPLALEKMGVELCVSQNVAEYNAGRTTQIPAGNVINTGERRITRKLVFGQQRVTYETNRKTPKRDT
jgi:Family of unknown function (DUF6088)